MADGFRIATAFVQVTPDTEGFREKLQAALDEATEGAKADVKVGIDREQFDADLDDIKAKLDELNEKRAEASAGIDDEGVDGKLDDIKAKLDELNGKTAKPKADLDDDPAKAKIAELQAELQRLRLQKQGITIRADASDAEIKIAQLEAQIAALRAESEGTGTGGSSGNNLFGSMASNLGGFVQAHALMLGVVAPMMPGIAAGAAGMGMLGATAGLAFGNIASALTAHMQATEQAAANRVQLDQQVAASEMNLSETTRNAALSQSQAIEAVTQAQQQQQIATASLSEAQYGLQQAWIQARYALQQLNDAQHNSATSIKAAELAVAQARYNRLITDQNAMSTSLERRQADLAVTQAIEQLTAAQQQAVYVSREAHLQNKRGVSGSMQVVQAELAMKQAIFAVKDARWNSAMAQKQLVNTELNNAAQVKQAQMAVVQAQIAATGGMNQFAAVMARLSKPGQAIVNMLLSMHGGLRMLEHVAQNAVAPGILAFLRSLQGLMPEIRTGVRLMGHAMSNAFGGFARLMGTAAFRNGLMGLIRNGVQFTNVVLPAIAQFLQMMGKVGGMKGAGAGIEGLLTGIIHAFTGLVSGLAPGLKAIGAVFTTLGGALGTLGKPLGHVISALAGALMPIVKALLPPFKTLITALGNGLVAALRGVGQFLTPVAQVIGMVVTALAPLLPMIGHWIGQLLTGLTPVLVALLPLFRHFTALIPLLLKAVAPLIPSVLKLALALLGTNGPVTLLLGLLVKLIDWFTTLQATVLQSVDQVSTTLSHLFDYLATLFSEGVSKLSGAWNLLTEVFKTPVNFLIQTVYDNGIRRLWDDVVGAIGMGSMKLPFVAKLAQGGVLPGYSPGNDTIPAKLSPGEGVLNPNAVQAIGPGTVNALNSAFPASSSKPSGGGHGHLGKIMRREATRHGRKAGEHTLGFAHGGLVGDLGNWFSSIGSKLLSGVSFLKNLATNPAAAIEHALSSLLHTSASGELGRMMVGLPQALIRDLGQFIGAGGGKGGGTVSAPVTPTGRVASWFSQAMKRTLAPRSWLPDLETIAWYESSDRPDAINLTDSNAKAGDPSRGLMQLIMTTFQAYHQQGTSPDIYDPVANIAAGINYIRARYGNPGLTPGILALAHGQKYVGYDSGGWAMPGVTGIVNKTGKPEAVLTPEQSRAFLDVASRMGETAGGAGEPQITMNYYGTQKPTTEQQSIMMRDLALAIGGIA